MAVNIHVKLSEIEGEATDPKFDKQISAWSYSWGAKSPSAALFTTGGASRTATARMRPEDLTFTKSADKASTQLLHALYHNTAIAKAIITLTKAGGKDPVDFLVITLEQVRVSGVQTRCTDDDEEDDYYEEVTLSFAKFTEEYFAQDGKGKGKPTGSVSMDFSVSV